MFTVLESTVAAKPFVTVSIGDLDAGSAALKSGPASCNQPGSAYVKTGMGEDHPESDDGEQWIRDLIICEILDLLSRER